MGWLVVGTFVGWLVGSLVSWRVGPFVGSSVGWLDGFLIGWDVVLLLGMFVGWLVTGVIIVKSGGDVGGVMEGVCSIGCISSNSIIVATREYDHCHSSKN